MLTSYLEMVLSLRDVDYTFAAVDVIPSAILFSIRGLVSDLTYRRLPTGTRATDAL